MAAVVGTDEALAALPGGPVVAGGMAGDPISKLCFGVLLWEPLHMEDVMQWPVWIEKQLYIVSVCGWGGGGRGGSNEWWVQMNGGRQGTSGCCLLLARRLLLTLETLLTPLHIAK
jgi:hypothetical protein